MGLWQLIKATFELRTRKKVGRNEPADLSEYFHPKGPFSFYCSNQMQSAKGLRQLPGRLIVVLGALGGTLRTGFIEPFSR